MAIALYTVFRYQGSAPPGDNPIPPGVRLIWWQPSWTRVFPPHHRSFRNFVFWVMSRLKIFKNDFYSALIIEDERGELIHRTLCIPAWLQFPFMKSNDLQLGDVYSPPAVRRRGLGVFALRYCLQHLARPGRDIYYVAQPTNSASHRLALKAGFAFFLLARKHPTRTVGYYSLLHGASDYALVDHIIDTRLSSRQIARLVGLTSSAVESTDKKAESRPLRILAVIPVSDARSAMIFAFRQMAAMAARGHTIEIFELSGRRNLITLFGLLGAYRRHLRNFRPDVVHAHYGAMTGFFGVFGALGLAPVVLMFRGSDLNPVPSMPLWKTAPSHGLSRLAALGASQVICVSAELRNRLWLARSKAALIPTGVDTTIFHPSSREAARAALGWDNDVPVIFFNAGPSPKVKRIDLAEKVVAIARRQIGEIKFVIMDGGLPPNQVPTLMQASDCLLFTSDFEGSPTVVQEAMACNLPIVSVPVGDIPERLRDVVPSSILPRDPDRLAEAVVRILRERPRSNGYEVALRDVGTEATSRLLDGLYRHVAGVG